MPAPRATDPPTREGITLHRNGLFEIPEKRRSWSEAGYRARYDSDPVYVWTRTKPHDTLVRFRVAGPVSANVMIRSFLGKGEPVVVLWGDDPDPAAGDLCSDRAAAIPPELRPAPALVSPSTLAEIRALEGRAARGRP